MTKRVTVLLGGFFGPDGWATSVGMQSLVKQFPIDYDVKTYTWDQYPQAAKRILNLQAGQKPGTDKYIIVGYSGGGSRALWLNRDFPRAMIDLMVLYDPSPSWQMVNPNPSCRKVVLYQNSTPRFFGLGGGSCTGPQVDIVPVSQNHMLVQGNQTLHSHTLKLVAAL